MNPGRKRWLLRLIGLPVIGIIILLWISRQQSQNRLTIENRSGRTIVELTITAGEQSKTFRDVPAGKAVAVPFALTSTTKFKVAGAVSNGAIIGGHFSSLPEGPGGERPRLVVLPDGGITVKYGEQR
jgi:hypothetical protein